MWPFNKKNQEVSTIFERSKLVPRFREAVKITQVPKVARKLTILFTDGTSVGHLLNSCTLLPSYHYSPSSRISLIDGRKIEASYSMSIENQRERERHSSVRVCDWYSPPQVILDLPKTSEGLYHVVENEKSFAYNTTYIKGIILEPEYNTGEYFEYRESRVEPISGELS